MQPLKCILITDERPGHQKQSRGVVNALGNYVDITVQEELVSSRSLFYRIAGIFRLLLSILSSSRRDPVDLIIGTGSHTHIPVLTRKNQMGGKAVICMSPGRILQKYFDLCFIPAHDRRTPEPNFFETMGPPNTVIAGSDQDHRCGLILVGGIDRKSHHWENDAIITSIRELIDRSSMLSWTISSSPRTPVETENQLNSLAAESDQVTFFPFSDTEPGWVDRQYQAQKTVWITGDSMSMIYEALSAGCSVGILPIIWKKSDNKFAYSQKDLIGSRRAVTLAGWLAGSEDWLEQEPLNEADRCAREILKRWWPKNLR